MLVVIRAKITVEVVAEAAAVETVAAVAMVAAAAITVATAANGTAIGCHIVVHTDISCTCGTWGVSSFITS
eukprot:13953575-Ditylum_brightwellii.AAC.1